MKSLRTSPFFWTSLTATVICLATSGVQATTLSAAPNPCPVPVGQTTCTTSITWNATDVPQGQIWLSTDGGPESLFGCGNFGTQTATWIQAGHNYRFAVYQSIDCSQGTKGAMRTSILVNGVVAPPTLSVPATVNGVAGVAVNIPVTVNGATSVYGTGLPPGLSVATFLGTSIQGTPTSAGTFAATIFATNAGGSVSQNITFTIIQPPAPSITSGAFLIGTIGAFYQYQIAATNNPTSYNATGLPAGLLVNTVSGQISGTPTVFGTFSVTLLATNSGGTAQSVRPLTIQNIPPVLTSFTSASGIAGQPFFYRITATNNPTHFAATGLPLGLLVDSVSGIISGTVPSNGIWIAAMSASNSAGADNKTLALSILPPPPVITGPASAVGTAGVSFGLQMLATNAGDWSATHLPPGLSINFINGFISGTPSIAGPFTAAIQTVTTSGTANINVAFTIKPALPSITSAATAQGQQGLPFSYQIIASGSPSSFDATSLPAGLTVNPATGLISGAPTTAGSFTVTLNASNSSGTGQAPLALTILPTPPVVTSASTGSGAVGVSFTYGVTATNTPTSFDAVGLPAGLSIDMTTGLISGTPTAAGVTTVTLSAANAGGSGTSTLLLTILPPPPVITSLLTAQGQEAIAFTYQITATNNPTRFDAVGLPAGLSVNTTNGAITGTPATAGTTSVALKATSASGTGQATLVITVQPATPIVTSALAASGMTGAAFAYQIMANNGPSAFDALGLPAGLSIDVVTGLISGTPSAAGTSSITLSATNTGGTGTALLVLTISNPAPLNPVITSPAAAQTQVGSAFSYQITATRTPTGFDAAGLPAGLTIDTASGIIAGTPNSVGISIITLKATNASGTGNAALTLTVLPATPVITSAVSASGVMGNSFQYQILAAPTPTNYGASGLPPGLSINAGTGMISGVPTRAGNSAVMLSATNTGGTGTCTLSLTIALPAPVITSAGTAQGQVGAAFSYSIVASNSPTSFNATGLPSGMTVDTATGKISGTPSSLGTTTVTLNASNSTGMGNASLVLTVLPAAPVISSALTATGRTGAAFTYQIQASNLPTQYDASGLPAGLTIDKNLGIISGTPSAAGVFTLTLSAMNAGGTGTASLQLTITIPPLPPPVITSPVTANATVGNFFTYQIFATNAPTSYSAVGLPAGLSVNTVTGVIAGTAGSQTTASVTISATNASGTGSAALSLYVNSVVLQVPSITSPLTGAATVGVPYSYQITASNSPYNFTAAGLPAGLSLGILSGLISGTPTSQGAAYVTLRAVNSNGTGTAVFMLTVNPGAQPQPVITSAATALAQAATPFTFQIQATQNPTSYSAAGLPLGLSLNTATGKITGQPIGTGVFYVLLGAANSGGNGSQVLNLTVGAAPAQPPVVTAPTSLTATVGVSYIPFQITASNGPTGFNAAGLPPGLSIDPFIGQIYGAPTVAGNYPVTLSASNASGTGQVTVTFTINPSPGRAPVISNYLGTPQYATKGQSFLYTVAANWSPTSFGATGLPPGLNMQTVPGNPPTGLISGTPTSEGSYTVMMSATNNVGTSLGPLTIIVSGPAGQPPVAAFIRNPASGNAPLSVFFNAAYSYDPVGIITAYDWDFGDGQIGSGLTTTHLYSTPGDYYPKLTVTNNLGIKANASLETLVVQIRAAEFRIGNVFGAAGTDVDVPIIYTPSPDEPGQALQFDMDLPLGVSFNNARMGQAAIDAHYAIGTNPALGRVLMYGINTNLLGGGVLAIVNVHIAAGTTDQTLIVRMFNAGISGRGGNLNIPLNLVDGALTVSSTAGSSNLPAPNLALAGTVTPQQILSVGYPAGYTVQFSWTITPLQAGSSAAGGINSAALPAGSAAASGRQLTFGAMGMTTGRYHIEVVAVDPLGLRSLPAEADIILQTPAASSIHVYPNPWRADRPMDGIHFENLPNDSTIKLFTLSGRWVRSLTAPSGQAVWDLRNDAGDQVASGLYFYVATDNAGFHTRGTLGVVK